MDLLVLLAVILLVLWALGSFVIPVGTSAIHLLLVLIVIVIFVRVLRGQGL